MQYRRNIDFWPIKKLNCGTWASWFSYHFFKILTIWASFLISFFLNERRVLFICKFPNNLDRLISCWKPSLVDQRFHALCSKIRLYKVDKEGHSLSTCDKGGRAKAYAMRTRGRGLTHFNVHAKSPCLHLFCNIFTRKVLWFSVSYFVVFGGNFQYCFIRHLLLLLSCLSIFFTIFFSMKWLLG